LPHSGDRFARKGRYQIGPGLTDTEIARIEHDYQFEFADDHKAFLAAGLPLNNPPEKGQTWSAPWPDWRDGDPDDLRRQLGWPVEGALFDIGNGRWLPAWGQRPASTSEALDTARALGPAADGLVLERVPLIRRLASTSMANRPAAFANQSGAPQLTPQ
jgi:hypothetical protein